LRLQDHRARHRGKRVDVLLRPLRRGLRRRGRPRSHRGVGCDPIDRVADDVFQLRGRPRNAVNVYLAGDVLIDAGTARDRKRILSQLAGRTVSAHALTHAHPDHFGSSHAVCEALKIPLWCGENDAAVAAGERPPPGQGRAAKLLSRLPLPQPHPVERKLREGDQIAGFTVLDVPGHSPGHVAYWRESDRTLICGDVFFNLSVPTLRPGLREPYASLTTDPPRNRQSARRLAELQPNLVLFGHGPPLRDGDRLVRFAESLPA
jgi:hydroxyacylglutathione hydrolase